MFLGVFVGSFAQNVSDYQYLVIPKQFDFQKTANQYQINGLIKFLFEKQNFSPFWADSLPNEVVLNPCKSLKVNVLDNSNMFTTKVVITLTNCKGEVVFTSSEGKSREKNFTQSFNEAIRSAFEDVKKLNYKFSEKQQVNPSKEVPKLYAQPTENGFQLVDTTPKIVFKLQKTSLKDVFNATNSQNVTGIFYKEQDFYIFEYSEANQTIKQSYKVEFF